MLSKSQSNSEKNRLAYPMPRGHLLFKGFRFQQMGPGSNVDFRSTQDFSSWGAQNKIMINKEPAKKKKKQWKKDKWIQG